MDDAQLAIIATLLRRAPEWIRNDLGARDAATRQRAEEALAAMIAAALAHASSPGSSDGSSGDRA